MRYLRRITYSLLTVYCSCTVMLFTLLAGGGILLPAAVCAVAVIIPSMLFAAVLVWPQRRRLDVKRLQTLSNGYELLFIFLISVTATVILQIYFIYVSFKSVIPWNGISSVKAIGAMLGSVAVAVIFESLIFWAGMGRLYLRSVQLGIKHRVLGALFGWIPGLNIYYLIKIMRIVNAEIVTESEKNLLNEVRKERSDCAVKYPLLLVHGVFFRDFRYLNYWGRISGELKRNGAEIFYGKQQSAASVEDCGRELAERISDIVKQTGCEKVNIIAHSKGGLDSRAAITHFGAAPYVASLTTVNTPHRGCLFADYLLDKTPEKIRNGITNTYNKTLKKLGDASPDFLSAVSDLTAAACEKFNAETPDSGEVFYQSVMSYCKKARSGKFPLNLSYHLVKHFDGRNDGLVSVDSAEWGEKFTLIEPAGSRGISHGDVIDLNRENIPGFDVREFYVGLVSDLKNRGF